MNNTKLTECSRTVCRLCVQMFPKSLFSCQQFAPPNIVETYLGLFSRLTTSLSEVGHLGLSNSLLQLLGRVQRKVHNSRQNLVDASVEGQAVPLVDEGIQQQELGDVVVGDAAGQPVSRLGDAKFGVLLGEAEVGDAALKGRLGGCFAGGEVGCDLLFGQRPGDLEGVALVLEVVDLGFDDPVEFLLKVCQEFLQNCWRALAAERWNEASKMGVLTSCVLITKCALLGG